MASMACIFHIMTATRNGARGPNTPSSRHANVTPRFVASALFMSFLAFASARGSAADGHAGLGLPEASADTAAEHERAAIGQRLFFDRRLSADGTISCAICHLPERAFTDGRRVARGIGGKTGTRNTPSLLNVAFQSSFFWDGRRDKLEAQVLDPLTNPIEHGLKNIGKAVATVRNDRRYVKDIQRVFAIAPDRIEPAVLASALASFVRTLVSGDSPFDRYRYGHDTQAISASAKRGLGLFEGRAACASCHLIGPDHALFTDGKFHSVGILADTLRAHLGKTATAVVRMDASALDSAVLQNPDYAALGRFVVTHQPEDIGAFRTPSLRNVALTAPYMHDGSVATLAEAVDAEIYYRGTETGRPLILTPQEKADLLAFLAALSGPGFVLDIGNGTGVR